MSWKYVNATWSFNIPGQHRAIAIWPHKHKRFQTRSAIAEGQYCPEISIFLCSRGVSVQLCVDLKDLNVLFILSLPSFVSSITISNNTLDHPVPALCSLFSISFLALALSGSLLPQQEFAGHIHPCKSSLECNLSNIFLHSRSLIQRIDCPPTPSNVISPRTSGR